MHQKSKHMHSKYYRFKILPQVVNHVKNKLGLPASEQAECICSMTMPPHIKLRKWETLAENKGVALPHLPYPPDLAPCDIWLFPLLMARMAGMKFTLCQDLAIHSVPGPTSKRGQLSHSSNGCLTPSMRSASRNGSKG